MPSPEQERIEALNKTIVQLIRRQNELEKRLAFLERQTRVHPAAPEPFPAALDPTPAPSPDPEIALPAPPSLPWAAADQTVAAASPSQANVALETKVGLTLINRIGVVTLVLGVAFFFKWAVDNNWIGPAGRVMLGILAGLATAWVGDLLWRRGQRAFAQGITGTGIAVLYLAFYSSFGFYHLIPQALAFVLMCAVTGLAFALSLRYDSPAVTALGLLGGYLTPIFLSTGEDHPWFLFSYVFLLDAVAMALAKRRSWKLLEVMGAVATALIYGAWLLAGAFSMGGAKHPDRPPAIAALFAYYALFSRIFNPFLLLPLHVLAALAIVLIAGENPAVFYPVALLLAAAGLAYAEQKSFPYMLSAAFASFWLSYALYRASGIGSYGVAPHFIGITAAFLLFFLWNIWLLSQKRQQPTVQRLSVVALNGVVYYAAAYQLLDQDHHAWLGLLAIAVAGTYLGLGAFLYRHRSQSQEDRPLLLSLGMALAFATLAIPIQFTAFTITVAWSIEAAVLSWLAWRLRNQRAMSVALFVFALVAVRLLLIDGSMLPDPRAYSLLWNERFLTFAVASTSFFLAARWTLALARDLAVCEYFAGHLVLLWGLSLEIAAWAKRAMPPSHVLSAATLSLSILYGLYALILVSAGVATRTALNRIAGLILIGLIIAKLYLFDVWQLQRPYRISAFIALGILLISTSFLYSRFRPLIESLLTDAETPS